MDTTTQRRQYKTLEVLEAALILKTRINLDKYRNKLFSALFKFLDTNSKKLDSIAAKKIQKFDMAQYWTFRDITQSIYDARDTKLTTFGKPLGHDVYYPHVDSVPTVFEYDFEDTTFDEEEYY